MSRQQLERLRVLSEMMDRYGSDDAMVREWSTEVDSIQALDLRYPHVLPAWNSVKMLSAEQCPSRARRIHCDAVKH